MAVCRHLPMKAQLHHWVFTDRPCSAFSLIICGQILLVIIDSHSKWLQVHITSTVISEIKNNEILTEHQRIFYTVISVQIKDLFYIL